VPAKDTDDGIRAIKGAQVIEPNGVRRYLDGKFGENLGAVRSAMQRLAKSFSPKELADRAFGLYERFRPSIPEGVNPSSMERQVSRTIRRNSDFPHLFSVTGRWRAAEHCRTTYS